MSRVCVLLFEQGEAPPTLKPALTDSGLISGGHKASGYTLFHWSTLEISNYMSTSIHQSNSFLTLSLSLSRKMICSSSVLRKGSVFCSLRRPSAPWRTTMRGRECPRLRWSVRPRTHKQHDITALSIMTSLTWCTPHPIPTNIKTRCPPSRQVTTSKLAYK